MKTGSVQLFEGDVPFSCVDKSYLIRFEQWMVNIQGMLHRYSRGQARAMRVMFIEAIEGTQIISQDAYPFRQKEIPDSIKEAASWH